MKIDNGTYNVTPKVNYISQFASKNLVSDILDQKILAGKDPKWKTFGFDNVEDYDFWSWRACGIVCIKMILDAYNKNITVKELVDKGVSLGGYIVNDEKGNFVDKGWYHKPLADLVNYYGFYGKAVSNLTIDDICNYILNNTFIIASVNPNVIRFDCDKCENKGGHLVLVTGFKWDGKCLGFNIFNPSGRTKETRENAFIPIERFNESFSKRGIIVKKNSH